MSSRIGNLSLVNSEQTRLCLIKLFSPVSPKNVWKTKFFEKLFFFKMIFRTGQMQLWQTCRTLPPKSDNFYRKIQMLWKKMLHNSAEIQSFLKCPPVHVKCTFDNSSWSFQLNMETIHTKIPKKMREYKNVGNKSQNLALELINAVLSTVQKQGCH